MIRLLRRLPLDWGREPGRDNYRLDVDQIVFYACLAIAALVVVFGGPG